ncbi:MULTISPECIES: FGGY-family carbohydrate kinase [Bacillus]|uniref:FGGY family carbohydrate kinase n=1 Tax=Bacillus rugosus TaxID=2715209 RepID=A0ACD4A4A3_9BACI|nr:MULTISPECIES: FGGY family carbohydrate kinase [Bacillus]MBY4604140.1 sugar kinase [Bacillus sp. SPARC3]UPV80991.1 FGGY family carbohydrate kinase [Bacillus rugosus]
MKKQKGYLVFDIGTGNARVAVVSVSGNVQTVEREDIVYSTDTLYPDSRYFSPQLLWKQVMKLAKRALSRSRDIDIIGLTSTSQRQGIVLIDQNGDSFLGLPNIDNRGREWEECIPNREEIYSRTGRLPTALFSALKLYGLKQRQPSLWQKTASFTSISDWVTYQLSGVLTYEPSQATETLLFDVKQNTWSEEMCGIFGFSPSILPPLVRSGTAVGTITNEYASELGLSKNAKVIAGGGDTQLAVKSTRAALEDIAIVSGTTTPITKITAGHGDTKHKAWLNCHTDQGHWLVETNPGITGLNYQKLKQIFYPNESYEVMEEEISALAKEDNACVAALGSYLSAEKNALTKGGFLFDAPLSANLKRAHFVRAALQEIAFSIKWNFDILTEVTSFERDYVWVCGGGFQSKALTQYTADLLQKKIYVQEGYHQASVVGAAVICNETFQLTEEMAASVRVIKPQDCQVQLALYEEWKQTQRFFSSSDKVLI